MKTIMFAVGISAVCAVLVSSSAVLLRDRQDFNKLLDQQKKVLVVAGLMEQGEKLPNDEIGRRFDENLVPRLVNLETGEYADDVDVAAYDQRKAAKDAALSETAPKNSAKVMRLPKYAKVYLRMDGDKVKSIVLPIEGYGLWSTLYGYLALGADSRTIEGITYYEHGETAGLGGEVDNPKWKALWPGRQAYDEDWNVAIHVRKGYAGPPDQAPYEVDGLSGATLTSNGVSNMLEFWLGENGFGPYLANFRKERGIS